VPAKAEVEVRTAEATSSGSGWWRVIGCGYLPPSNTMKLQFVRVPPHPKSLFLVSESEYGNPNELPDIEQISLFQFVEVILIHCERN
jgi:hypothetical protein